MADLHRVESVLAERKLALIAAFADHRICAAARDDLLCGAEVAEAEVGAALTVGRGEAARLIGLATALSDRLPRVRAAMAAGEIDAYRAGLIERATRNVADEFIAEVERLALEKILAPSRPDGIGLTGQRARNAIGRIIGRIDPAGVRERRRRAMNDRYVGVSAAEDAMVSLFGRCLLPTAASSTPGCVNWRTPPAQRMDVPSSNAKSTRWVRWSTDWTSCPVPADARTARNNRAACRPPANP